jgi:ATP-dependent DNA ligase
MRIKRLPARFVIPAQPVMASKPPSGADWVHEIKHDGYRLIIRRDGAEGIVSKRVDGTYRSGPCKAWIKVRNPASLAVQRKRSENWNRRASGSARKR